jgi:ribosomal protein S18 acetylase RimI-like enzyme
MHVQLAAPEDTGAIYRLLDNARHARLTLGNEDLTEAITAGRVLLLQDDDQTPQQPSGMLVTLAEERPSSLPDDVPSRVYLRGVAFRRTLSPTTGLQHLLQAFITTGSATPHPRQLIAYGGEGWLDRALHSAGMTQAEQVQYFALERLQKRDWPTAPAPCTIVEATPADLPRLAVLDAHAFDPLWHYTQRHLQEALFSGPLLAGHAGDDLAGYIALLLDRTTCTIARLGVHPGWQGQGIGRALLLAGLRRAQAWGCSRALLNTQATNYRSQQLYRSFGFRPTGESFAVFVLDLPGAPAHPTGLEVAALLKR